AAASRRKEGRHLDRAAKPGAVPKHLDQGAPVADRDTVRTRDSNLRQRRSSNGGVIRRFAAIFIVSLLAPVLAARSLQTSGPPITADDIAGVSAADLSHAGETPRVILHIEKTPDGRLTADCTTPAIHFWEVPVG